MRWGGKYRYVPSCYSVQDLRVGRESMSTTGYTLRWKETAYEAAIAARTHEIRWRKRGVFIKYNIERYKISY